MYKAIPLLMIPVILAIIIPTISFSQGCSDAGACTLGPMNASLADDEIGRNTLNSFTAGMTYGKGENSVSIITPYIEYFVNLSDYLQVGGKLTFVSADGKLGSSSYAGDLFLSADYVIDNDKESRSSVLFGVKIPFSDANMKVNDMSLPMVYQSSVGTYDLILGYSYFFGKFSMGLAVQQPIAFNNKNKYSVLSNTGEEAFPTRNLERQGDILLRLTYNIKISDDLYVAPGILPIYHLADDIYKDNDEKESKIPNSKGLTFNGILMINYKIAKSDRLTLSMGAPFINRDAIPDGLKRFFVVQLEYNHTISIDFSSPRYLE